MMMHRLYSDKNYRDISDISWYNYTIDNSHATASVTVQNGYRNLSELYLVKPKSEEH